MPRSDHFDKCVMLPLQRTSQSWDFEALEDMQNRKLSWSLKRGSNYPSSQLSTVDSRSKQWVTS